MPVMRFRYWQKTTARAPNEMARIASRTAAKMNGSAVADVSELKFMAMILSHDAVSAPDIDDCFDGPVEVLARVRGADLATQSRRALRNDGETEAGDVDA